MAGLAPSGKSFVLLFLFVVVLDERDCGVGGRQADYGKGGESEELAVPKTN